MNDQDTQMLAYQADQMQKIIENIDTQLNEVKTTEESLLEFKNLKGNEEVLFPLANGIFSKGILTDNKILKMNVGNNVVVEKTVDEAIDMMHKQYDEIYAYKQQLIQQLEELLNKLRD